MNMQRCIVGLFFLSSVGIIDARVGDVLVGDRKGGSDTESMPLSPAVTQSDKKFFGKDYPWDKRPKVDVLHFKHPYPIIQDSGDFDRDYVKDENSDNGEFNAQTEYDRLRHKLAKEKADVAAAQRAKTRAEQDLQDALRREKMAKQAAEEKQRAAEAAAEARRRAAAARKAGKADPDVGPGADGAASRGGGIDGEDEHGLSRGAEIAAKTKVASEDAEKAVEQMEECKRQLAQARENLKRLMDELDAAKKAQQETQEALERAIAQRGAAQGEMESTDKGVPSRHEDYLAAKAAYEKQLAIVAQMEKDIEAAARKVQEIRDSEDNNGGVYNTHDKSTALYLSPFFALCASVFALAF